jgi:hypothetical protein
VLKLTGRDIPEAEYAVIFDGADWAIDGAGHWRGRPQGGPDPVDREPRRESTQIIEFVTKHPEGVRAKDVAAFLGVEDKVARVYLGRLADNGRLERADRGLYISVASVASVISAGQDDAGTQHSPQQVLRSGEPLTRESNTSNTAPPCPDCGHPADSDEHGRLCEGDAA